MPECGEGVIDDACTCGGAVETAGYCCAGAHQADVCIVPDCEDGPLSEACTCHDEVVSAGYCCSVSPQGVTCNTAGTTYYVSEDGDDGATGTSPTTAWESLTRVNAATLAPGDQVLFRSGDRFRGTLVFEESGAEDAPITYSWHGAGDLPVITGFTEITEWTDAGGGLFTTPLTAESQTNMVTVDGVNTGMGRYPDDAYLTFESFDTNISITDDELPGAPDWTGAEVVLRKNNWTQNRYEVLDHTGDTIVYNTANPQQNARAGFGYFIQNDLRTVDQPGEWFHDHDAGVFTMGFDGAGPGARVVRIATLDHLVHSSSNNNHVTIDGLAFEGAISDCIDLFGWRSDWLTVTNSELRYCGQNGVRLNGTSNTTITDNTISVCSGAGVYAQSGGDVITGNTIDEMGTIAGAATRGTDGNGVNYRLVDLEWVPQTALIQHNDITSTGYNGVHFSGNNVEVRNNFVADACLMLDDCAGIYTGGDIWSGRIIEGNIVLRAVGNTAGTPHDSAISEGIYLDETATDVLVSGNTVAHCTSSGIKIHKSHTNILRNNTAYDNAQGIGFENWHDYSTIHSNELTGNIFFAREATQRTLRFLSMTDDVASFGTASDNIYARPIDDTDTIQTRAPSTGTQTVTLASWQTLTVQDADSRGAPQAVTDVSDIAFHYNATQAPVSIPLSEPMVDAAGVAHDGSVTLEPYTSVILMVAAP